MSLRRDAMKIMNEAVFRFLNRKPAKWTLSGGMNLNGLIALFRAAGDQDCRCAVLDYMESSVSPEGTIFCTSACTPADLAACGKALFFALDETGEDRYKKALDAVASRVKEAALPETPAGLYAAAPFLPSLLHGLLTFSGEAPRSGDVLKLCLLKSVEYGAAPFAHAGRTVPPADWALFEP